MKKTKTKIHDSDHADDKERIYDFNQSEEDRLKVVLFEEVDGEISFKDENVKKYTSLKQRKPKDTKVSKTGLKSKENSVVASKKKGSSRLDNVAEHKVTRKRKATEEVDAKRNVKVAKKVTKVTQEIFEPGLFEELQNLENIRRNKRSKTSKKRLEIMESKADSFVADKENKVSRARTQKKHLQKAPVSLSKATRVVQLRSESKAITDFLTAPAETGATTSTPTFKVLPTGTADVTAGPSDYNHVLPSPMLSPIHPVVFPLLDVPPARKEGDSAPETGVDASFLSPNTREYNHVTKVVALVPPTGRSRHMTSQWPDNANLMSWRCLLHASDQNT